MFGPWAVRIDGGFVLTSTRSADAEGRLRRALSKLSLQLRRPAGVVKPDIPRFVSYDQVRQADGTLVGRKKVILMSGGCSVPTCTMCPFTNENNYGRDRAPQGLLDQVAQALARTADEPPYEMLALYNDGSFFAPREIPAEVRLEIAARVAAAGVRHLVVESLPQFVTLETLEPFVERLGPVSLEIGVGLQSADDLVRETLVNTRISRKQFEGAVAAMRICGVLPKIYLMIKPPLLTDGEAITDVVESVRYVRNMGIDAVTLCPTRVSPNTVAWQLYQAGEYTPPNLWTVVEAVRQTHHRAAVRVACINLRGNDFASVFPDSCPVCADRVVDALLRYSETGDLEDLPEPCACRPDLAPLVLDHDVIVERGLHVLAREEARTPA